jgi:hypothetical protein
MTIRVDAYTTEGMTRGLLARAGHLREALDASDEVLLERASWQGPDDPAPGSVGSVTIAVDDIVVAVTDGDPTIPVHAVWHPVHLEAGSYLVDAEIPTMPGFDPGRALTRPTGSFVVLRDVRMRRTDSSIWPPLAIAEALVNRYVVELVEAELPLEFLFPGAEMIHTDPDVADLPRQTPAPGSVAPAAPATIT